MLKIKALFFRERTNFPFGHSCQCVQYIVVVTVVAFSTPSSDAEEAPLNDLRASVTRKKITLENGKSTVGNWLCKFTVCISLKKELRRFLYELYFKIYLSAVRST